MLKNKFLMFILFILFIFYSTVGLAADVTLAWDANTESDLAGYYIHYKIGESGGPPYNGTGATNSDSPIQVPKADLVNPENPEYTVNNLSDTEITWMVATAYDTDGNQSGYSNEVFYAGTIFEIPNNFIVDYPDSVMFDGIILVGTTNKIIHAEWEVPLGGVADHYSYRLYDVNKKTYVLTGDVIQNSLDFQLPLSGIYYLEVRGVRVSNETIYYTEWKRVDRLLSGWPAPAGPIIIE